MSSPEHRHRRRCGFRRQQGLTLVELLVGLALGLLVITAALGTLVFSRAVSAAASEMSQLQQQGSFALRVMGLHLRQAGSTDPVRDANGLHAFAAAPAGGFDAAVGGSEGRDGASDSVSVRAFHGESPPEQMRDCLGNKLKTPGAIEAVFSVNDKMELGCASQERAAPLIGNVADFQVRYRARTGAGLRVLSADEIEALQGWASVEAIEICIDLQGKEKLVGATAPYIDCHGAEQPRHGTMHLIFRNVFDLRTQGL